MADVPLIAPVIRPAEVSDAGQIGPERAGELMAIYLLPEAWSTGTGRRLMAAVIDGLTALGHAEATLWVLDSNDRARRFYARAGWAEDGAVQSDDSRGFTLNEVRYRIRLRSR